MPQSELLSSVEQKQERWIEERRKDEAFFNDPCKQMDVLCRIVFPVLFVLFNLYFWTRYAVYWGDE